MTASRHLAAAGVLWTAAALTVNATTQLLQLMAGARLLEPEDVAIFVIVVAVVGLTNVLVDSAVNTGIVQREKLLPGEQSSLYLLNLAVGAVLFVAIFAAAGPAGRLFDSPNVASALGVASLVVLVAPFGQQFRLLLQRRLRFRTLAVVETLASTLMLIVSVSLLLLDFGVVSLSWGLVCAACLRSGSFVVIGLRLWRPVLRFRFSEVAPYLRLGLFLMADQAVVVLAQQIDRFLVGFTVGPRLLGFYTVASEMALRPNLLINAVLLRVAFPILSRAQHDTARLELGYLTAVNLAAHLLTPLLMAVSLFAEPIVLLLFGDRWQPAIPILRIYAIVGWILCIEGIGRQLSLATGRTELGFLYSSLLLISNIVAVTMLAPFGLEAVAWGLAASVLLLSPLMQFVRRRCAAVSFRKYLRAIAPPVGAGLLASAAVVGLSALTEVGNPRLPATWLAGLLFVSVYAPSAWLLDREALSETVATFRNVLVSRSSARRSQSENDSDSVVS